ncbi:MAG: 16S rRNA (guanine(527)-N(7))-methyltransferase RsmG [Burkholderiales bacterium]
MSDALMSRLRAGAQTLGLTLDAQQLDQLLAYLALLARWNKTYNLTAIRDPEQMLVQHLLDSLAVIAPLVGHTHEQPSRLLDVGSGGGLPGVVLAIARPELAVTCVDTVGKKATFIRQVAAELHLPNLQARHARVEALQEAAFDVITARAFASLTDLVRLTRALLSPGGVWMAMKGQHPVDELAALPADVAVFHVEPLLVPELGAERCLVWMAPKN